ncbi:unnamed protein product [Dibothriocephalus latus]|uniref:Uncharacterized protein n=1 Tax=Dibothriocephalus latus TaxID=60516 RepID=A0A3P7P4W8_DIBLA|nr:unnamed protein product [Dibothriocephalus latus]
MTVDFPSADTPVVVLSVLVVLAMLEVLLLAREWSPFAAFSFFFFPPPQQPWGFSLLVDSLLADTPVVVLVVLAVLAMLGFQLLTCKFQDKAEDDLLSSNRGERTEPPPFRTDRGAAAFAFSVSDWSPDLELTEVLGSASSGETILLGARLDGLSR